MVSDLGQELDAVGGRHRQHRRRAGIDRFAVLGDSGGGPHALACAAVLPGRVLATVCMAGPADGLDSFAGMTPSGAAEYRAAASGRAGARDLLRVRRV